MVGTNHAEALAQVADLGVTPLDAQAGVEALMSSGIGTLIQFGLFMMSVALTVGGLFAIGAAGLSQMSQNTSKQQSVSKYVAASGIMFACAMVLGAGPEILTALGFETFEHISAVRVFSG